MECTLYLTENCNLKCNYCYEGNDKRSKTLNNQDLEKAISFIVQNNPQNENINLTFLGGEPLLNKDAIYLCMDIINHKWSQSKELFKILKTCFRTAAEQLMKQYQVGWVVQGTCYNDLILYNDEQIEIRFPMMKPKEVQLKTFYSDAVKCKLVCEKEPNTGINSLVSNTYLSAA